MNEAQSRDSNFRDFISYPGLASATLQWEYTFRSRAWRNAMFEGLQWTGVPGFRGLALGQSRGTLLGSGGFNKMGINRINPLFQRLTGKSADQLKQYGLLGSEKGTGILGKILGGTHTGILRVADVPEASRPAVQKALETNWIKALFSEEAARSRFANAEENFSNLARTNMKKGMFLGTRKTAWKFAVSQRFMPGLVWASNLAFVASLTAPLFSAAGNLIANGITSSENLIRTLNNRQLDFGGKIHQTYMNGPGMTERQRALNELQRSRTNARSFIGGEASMYHS